MVSVNGSKASLISALCSFINSSAGALSVYDGGEFKGETVVFMNNNPGIPSFPSMRYNVICLSYVRLSSLVNILSVGAGSDGETANTSMWINSVENCQLTGLASTYTSAFYIPTLTGMDITREISGGVITIRGAHFVPCELSCTLTADDRSFGVELTAINESVAVGVVNESVVVFLEVASNVGLTLTGQNGQELTEANSSDLERTSQTSQLNKNDKSKKTDSKKIIVILLVLAFVLVALLVFLNIMLILRYFRLKKENRSLQEKALDVEMDDQKEREEEENADKEDVSDELLSQQSADQLNSEVVDPLMVQDTDGKPETEGLAPEAAFVPQSEIQELVGYGSADLERGGEGEEESLQKKKKKKKKKKKAQMNQEAVEENEKKQTVGEEVTENNPEEVIEVEVKQLDAPLSQDGQEVGVDEGNPENLDKHHLVADQSIEQNSQPQE